MKWILMYSFFDLQNSNEGYLIAKNGKANVYLLLKLIETVHETI